MSKHGLDVFQYVLRQYTITAHCRPESLHDYEIIVFLAPLNEQVFTVDEVVGSDDAVESGELLLVERHATALHELAHLALACKHGGILREEVAGRLSELVGRNLKLRHTLENIEKCLFVELQQAVFR